MKLKEWFDIYTRKKWEEIILNPFEYQLSLTNDHMQKLGSGTEYIDILGGKFSILIKHKDVAGQGKSSSLFVNDKTNIGHSIMVSPIDTTVKHTIFLGPEKSGLLFIEVNSGDVKSVWYVIGLPELSQLNRVGGS